MDRNVGAYEPRYLDSDALPAAGPDTYDVEDKRAALQKAEPRVEMDLVGGGRLPDDYRIPIVYTAIAELASYYLVRGATSPSDQTLGDVHTNNDEKTDYVEGFRDEYDRIIESIVDGSAGVEDTQRGVYYGATPTESGRSIAVNTRTDPSEVSEYAKEDFEDQFEDEY